MRELRRAEHRHGAAQAAALRLATSAKIRAVALVALAPCDAAGRSHCMLGAAFAARLCWAMRQLARRLPDCQSAMVALRQAPLEMVPLQWLPEADSCVVYGVIAYLHSRRRRDEHRGAQAMRDGEAAVAGPLVDRIPTGAMSAAAAAQLHLVLHAMPRLTATNAIGLIPTPPERAAMAAVGGLWNALFLGLREAAWRRRTVAVSAWRSSRHIAVVIAA